MKNPFTSVAIALTLAGFTSQAGAQSQTAQSAMVALDVPTAYQITGELTWTYDRDAAETYYSQSLVSGPIVTEGSGAFQAAPAAPAPLAHKLMQHAQAQRCVFFNGGTLDGLEYTQTVTGTRGWKWEYTYRISPLVDQVAPRTNWSSEVKGGTVDIDVEGFVSSESFLKQANGRTKYSFTLLESDGVTSRVQGVSIRLEKLNGSTWETVGEPTTYSVLPVSATAADYRYFGNAGVFGNTAVFSQLHAGSTGLAAANISGILAADNFANNNADLANGAVHQANYAALFTGISEEGTYRIVVSGTIKGNSASAGFGFNVVGDFVVIGGCQHNH